MVWMSRWVDCDRRADIRFLTLLSHSKHPGAVSQAAGSGHSPHPAALRIFLA